MATTRKSSRGISATGRKARRGADRYCIVGPDGKQLRVSKAMQDSVNKLAEAILAGEVAAVIPVEQELTTQEAADLLNVSRQYVVRLIDEGKIPGTRTGKHRRVRLADVLRYRAERDARRRRQLRELSRMTREAGGYPELDEILKARA
jgi:excisionase family DNA binding protein